MCSHGEPDSRFWATIFRLQVGLVLLTTRPAVHSVKERRVVWLSLSMQGKGDVIGSSALELVEVTALPEPQDIIVSMMLHDAQILCQANRVPREKDI